MSNKRAAFYVRVSTRNGQTTENQLRDLRAYCERNDYVIRATYDDTGESGAKADRPALQQMLADAGKKFDVLLVWKLDRLGRSVPDLLRTLQQLRDSGVDFICTTQQIDTSTAYGRMVTTFLAAVAEFERELTIERVRLGQARAREQGVRIGRPRAGFDVNRALELKRGGLSWKKLSRQMAVSVSTLRRTLSPLLRENNDRPSPSSPLAKG